MNYEIGIVGSKALARGRAREITYNRFRVRSRKYDGRKAGRQVDPIDRERARPTMETEESLEGSAERGCFQAAIGRPAQ